MKYFSISVVTCCMLASAAGTAVAKLPALDDEAKGKAAEAAAKSVWSGKVDAYQLCKSQDKIAASYFQKVKASGGNQKVTTTTPPCTDPGAFSYVPPDAAKLSEVAKPIEAAGAHSPAATAASPPSGKQSDSVVNPEKKP
jgi:hypothetical protein